MKHKRLLTLLLALLLLASLTLPALAAPAPGDGDPTAAVTRAEQTKWYYRVQDGQLQKRLWSLTYEKWLTDWMPV